MYQARQPDLNQNPQVPRRALSKLVGVGLAGAAGLALKPSVANATTEVPTGSVATIGALRDARIFFPTQTVDVLGYYAPGDGGGGLFFWDANAADPDNGGTVIQSRQSATGRWRRLLSGWFSVKWFGAKGDNRNDDTQPIRATINAVRATPSGGTVFFPAGTYRVTATIEVNTVPPTRLRLTGEGYASTIAITGVQEGIVADFVWNLEISNLRFAGAVSRMIHIGGHPMNNGPVFILDNFVSGATELPGIGDIIGISVVNIADAWIIGNVVTGCGHADGGGYGHGYNIAGDVSGNGSSRVHIRNNTVKGDHTAYGIVLYNASYSDIQDNIVDGGGALNRLPPDPVNGDFSGYGIVFYSNPATTYNTVSGNHVSNTAGSGIYMQSSPYSAVVGNVLERVCLSQDDSRLVVGGIASNAGPMTITGNLTRNSGKSGIVVEANDHAVSGNVIEECAETGIQLNGICTNVTVSGNVVKSAKHGIRTFGADPITRVSITGNTVDTCRLDGMILLTANDCVISGNDVSNAVNHLIIIQAGSRNVIDGNRCSSTTSDAGIDVRTDDTLVMNNIVSNCFRGISEQGSYNAIVNNNVVGNANEAILSRGTSVARSGNRLTLSALTGMATLAAGTTTVITTEVQAGDRVRIQRITLGSLPGVLAVSAVINGSFTVSSSSGIDDGTFQWEILH